MSRENELQLVKRTPPRNAPRGVVSITADTDGTIRVTNGDDSTPIGAGSSSIHIGNVETLGEGASATAEIRTEDGVSYLDLGIPQGPKGDAGAGEDGEDGEDGVSATIGIGTVTTGDPGTDAEVTNSGTASAAVLNFTIPRGSDGSGSSGYEIDAPPEIPNVKDDEFDSSDTLPGGSSAKWSWRNQGSATATVSGGVLVLTAPALSGVSCRCLFQSAPATPWKATARIHPSPISRNFHKTGIALSDGTKILYFGLGTNSGFQFQVASFTNATTFSAVGVSIFAVITSVILRAEDDGTNIKFSYSLTGEDWTVVYSEARTLFFASGPTQFGVMASSEDASYPSHTVCDWFRVT